ncbi:nephrin-like isoform X2 [Panulirus ornatus]|uniref:nephrin-like isoform X2 n=1 Tax=Panulirus ornatus TaxID=150431 RepID=UPI003A851A5C
MTTTPASSPAETALRSLKIIIHVALLFIVACVPNIGSVGGSQRFEVTPESVQVREGEDVTLQCVVADQQGRAQWTKDGFALGFQRHVPGYPRYSYLGDPERGQHHLLISSVSLTDDGEYQCQVGPSLTNPPIWAAANLTVIHAPASISIEGHSDGSVLEVEAGDQITLRCLVTDARPPPTLLWYKAGRQVDPAQVESYVVASPLPHRWSIRSQVVTTVEARDDGESVSCRAVHPAVDDGADLVVSLTLSVQHPPDPPIISGYQTGEVLLAGEHRILTCRAPGGNPRPSVLWYRAGSLLDDTYVSDASGATTNTLQLRVTTSADGDQYECRVDGDLLQRPLVADVTLTVHYPPSQVSLEGSSWMEEGGSLSMQCETSESNPPATLTWLVQGEAVASPAAEVRRGNSGGGWVTRSRLVWRQLAGTRQAADRVLVECRTHHPTLGSPLRKTMLLTVTKPVGAPMLEGDASKEVVAGTSINLTCSVQGGQPPPSIRIFKNGRLVRTEVAHGDTRSRAWGEVEVTPADNGSEVKCEVTSPASGTPRVTSTKLSVLFPPGEVSGSAAPRTSQEGSVVNLSCQTSPSFPPANITWRSQGATVHGAISYSDPAAFGGSITRSELQVRVTAEDNGRTYTCEASNGIGSSVDEEMTLNVLHGPVWTEKPSSHLVVREGSELVIRAKAFANPGPVRYWWRRGREVLVGAGGELRLGRINQDHAGNYTVSAYSQRGAINASFFLNVQHGPEDVEAPERVTVAEGDSVNIQCSAWGNPTPHLTWTRRNHTLASGDGVARLMLTNARREDTGVYKCRATGSALNSPAPATTKLIVKQPVALAEEGVGSSGSWAALGGRGQLVCHVRAAPSPSFVWTTQDGRDIHSDDKYNIRKPELVDGLVLWASVLEVGGVTPQDYGQYRCSATNVLGSGATILTLHPPKPPQQPTNFTVVSISNASVSLGWSPNPEDEMPVGFTVRYRAAGTLLYQYVNISEGSATEARVSGLSPGVEYNFSVQARNDQGGSRYVTPPITVTTLGSSATTGPGGTYRLTSLLLLVVVMSAVALLALNIAIIACILRRHRRKRSSVRSSSSTKTTSLATHGNTPTSSPEDHQHHHHHHHVIMSLDKGSPKAARSHQVGQQTGKCAGKHKGLRCPASPCNKCGVGKHYKTLKKSQGPFLSNGRIPQGGQALKKQNKKNESTFSQNRLSGNGKTSNHKKGKFHSTIIPEACSLIPKAKENRLSQMQERNSGEEDDDDQASVSSHESADTAIFCSGNNVHPLPPPGDQQVSPQAPRGLGAASYAHQGTQGLRQRQQQSRRNQHQQQPLQVQETSSGHHPPWQTPQAHHSDARHTDVHHSTSQYQDQNYHQAYVPGGPGPDSSPHSYRHSSPAMSITKKSDKQGYTQSTTTTLTDGKPLHKSPRSSTDTRSYHQQPDSPTRAHQRHLPPDSPPSTTFHQYHSSPETPSRSGHQRVPPSSPSRPQQRHIQPASTKVQHRHLPPDSPPRAQRILLPSNSPTRTQHHPTPPDSPTRAPHRRIQPPSPTTLQQHRLPTDSPPKPQRRIPHESPNRTQHRLPPESPTRVQHRPPPVPPKSSQHRPPPSPSKLGFPQQPISPRLRKKIAPSARPSSAQYSHTPSHMNLKQQSLRHSNPISSETHYINYEVPSSLHHEYPHYEMMDPANTADPRDTHRILLYLVTHRGKTELSSTVAFPKERQCLSPCLVRSKLSGTPTLLWRPARPSQLHVGPDSLTTSYGREVLADRNDL